MASMILVQEDALCFFVILEVYPHTNGDGDLFFFFVGAGGGVGGLGEGGNCVCIGLSVGSPITCLECCTS